MKNMDIRSKTYGDVLVALAHRQDRPRQQQVSAGL